MRGNVSVITLKHLLWKNKGKSDMGLGQAAPRGCLLWEEKKGQRETEGVNMTQVQYMKYRNAIMKPFTLYN